jgi:hypothetical protein
VLLEEYTADAGKIMEVTFEAVNLCPGKDYMCQSTIKTFLDERKPLDYL